MAARRITIHGHEPGLRFVAERFLDALLLFGLVAHLLHGAHLVQRLTALRLLVVDHVALVIEVLVHYQVNQIAEIVRLDVACDVEQNEVLADPGGEHLHFLAVGGRRQVAQASVAQERQQDVQNAHHQHDGGDDEEKCEPEPENHEDLLVNDVHCSDGVERERRLEMIAEVISRPVQLNQVDSTRLN